MNSESQRMRIHKWRLRNRRCVVCGNPRPSRIIVICTGCRKESNGKTQVRT